MSRKREKESWFLNIEEVYEQYSEEMGQVFKHREGL